MQRRHHYEQAFEDYLRQRRVPYVAVDEARKALLPEGHQLRVIDPTDAAHAAATGTEPPARSIKSFDLVIYPGITDRDSATSAPTDNLLVEVKGRRIAPRALRRLREEPPTLSSGLPATLTTTSTRGRPKSRLDSWATEDDIRSLQIWETLFGPGFAAVLVFIYWCEEQPPEPLFEEIFEYHGRWYAVRAIRVSDYASRMRPRSLRWRTVHLSQMDFDQLSGPLCGGGTR